MFPYNNCEIGGKEHEDFGTGAGNGDFSDSEAGALRRSSQTEREEDLSPEYRAAGHCYFAKVYGSYP